MTIGEQLKRERILLGITQRQMCAGIITESFYSRVENNKNEINIDDLIKILNKQHISFYDFFAPFSISPIDPEIQQAFINYNRSELKRLKDDQRSQDSKYQLEFKIMLAILDNKTEELSADLKQNIKYRVLHIGKFDNNFLVDLQLVMPFCDLDEIKLLIDYILTSGQGLKVTDDRMPFLLSTLIAYIKYCIKKKDYVEARRVIAYVQEMPNTSSTAC
ncbi:hypothetical protein GCM10019995_05360 [Lactobacillus kefiranofaciens subsp. kefirgranum]|uniref:helix-turn-helix domain-containing protein n=1 Tax=Lactobacillus kefiranofaciens TaxID=267818 RepID=UPI0006EED31B|nr:helix-turn-helix transcriptional regulator [Lactobacillus kefiranofaciens]KRL26427.1 hypothetical protein FC94_GL000824 [Lactobacillus kefiranofaciens subsp. kefirgranum DSM 10550 = JCM 8572]